MATTTISSVRLLGLAACVPRQRVTNHGYSYLSQEDRQKLIKTTGIETRHVVTPDQCTSDLCFAAAERLLAELGWDKSEIDVLVFVTQSQDYVLPATAPILQDRLSLPKTCLAFDISLGCSGYTYGLFVVASLLAAGRLRRALLLVGDTAHNSVSEQDRSAAPLFGDAGTASALAFDEAAPPMHFDLGSDGSGYRAIIVPHGGHRHPFSAESLRYEQVEEGIVRNQCQIAMDGVEVFNFSLREPPRTVRAVLDHARAGVEDVDACVFHQANLLMLELIRKKLKLPPEKVPYSLRDYGNTSSASIPLTVVSQLRDRVTGGRMRLLLCGFGVGLSWATALIDTDRLACPEVIEL